MKKIKINTTCKKMLADVYTPVGIYLRLRDRFRDTILLESTDFHAGENSYSFIGIHAIAGMEVRDLHTIECKLPGLPPEKVALGQPGEVPDRLWSFMQRFEVQPTVKEALPAQGLFGYSSYDAVQCFENIMLSSRQPSTINRQLNDEQGTGNDESGITSLEGSSHQPSTINRQLNAEQGTGNDESGITSLAGSSHQLSTANRQTTSIPLMRYRLYQYVIIINHFKDELYLCENQVSGLESELAVVERLIRNRDVPAFPFKAIGEEQVDCSNEAYLDMVKQGIAACQRGDVFQIVLSRSFSQRFSGDEFNVYRALRSINPSPYLFFFDYGDYRLMGSSPESQLIVKDGEAVVHPIAGTFRRTGDDATDRALAAELEKDEKENAEHVMLVDLARNDLSRLCSSVEVTSYKQVHYYSHVIHLVSEVRGKVPAGTNPFRLLAVSFPAGTLSGAPKYKAMQLIDRIEATPRGYYGGAIGAIGFNGSCNHAIMIRTFYSAGNLLSYRAGAGVVSVSKPESELQEVNNKLNALKQALILAQNI